jgi:uncharacterized protein YjcR
MNKAKNKASKAIPNQRNKYNVEHREKARKYYLMGLNLHEVSKLLDGCPVRTLEKWQQAEKWTELKKLFESGKTYLEIADLLKIGYTTVWRYLKQARKAEKV